MLWFDAFGSCVWFAVFVWGWMRFVVCILMMCVFGVGVSFSGLCLWLGLAFWWFLGWRGLLGWFRVCFWAVGTACTLCFRVSRYTFWGFLVVWLMVVSWVCSWCGLAAVLWWVCVCFSVWVVGFGLCVYAVLCAFVRVCG